MELDMKESLFEELKKIIIDHDAKKYFLGRGLATSPDNVDVFVWSTYDSLGVYPAFICHWLNVNPKAVPRKQPPRHSSNEHAEAVREKVNKLEQVGVIKELFYPEWLANTIVVKKNNEKWRVCVDFMDLNKAYPKHPFPVPRIDQLVDATVEYPRMSFLDAFQGYHQIPLALYDQEKFAFWAPIGNYHYWVMPFGLKNAGSTNQRIVTWMFEMQIRRNVEVYIDDMVVKSKQTLDHLEDLKEVFSILRR